MLTKLLLRLVCFREMNPILLEMWSEIEKGISTSSVFGPSMAPV